MRLGPLALAITLLGCAPTQSPWALRAAQADEAGLWSASESALLVVPGNIDAGASPEATATAAAHAPSAFEPSGCATATANGAAVTYVLDHCSGSFGLVQASGQMIVTFVASTDGRTTFHASATGLVLNGNLVSFEADAAVLHDATLGMRTIQLTIDSQGRGAAGTQFTRHGTQTAEWMDSWGCLVIDSADDMLTADGTSWQATASALTLCVGECPMTGGAIVWSGAPGRLELGYSGVRSVSWSGGTPSESGTLTLACGY